MARDNREWKNTISEAEVHRNRLQHLGRKRRNNAYDDEGGEVDEEDEEEEEIDHKRETRDTDLKIQKRSAIIDCAFHILYGSLIHNVA